MKTSRIVYVGLISLIILLGILSRRISIIPLSVGDVLWAMMIFFIVRLLFIDSSVRLIVLISLSICYLVEISQLYQEEWINSIRQTILR
ncbi:ribosomal maturation YjgA family protein [Arcticibacter tournemirensis]